jgi:hypothetical protein
MKHKINRQLCQCSLLALATTALADIYTNAATNELVWTLDTNALVLARRFYRSVSAQ